MFPVGPRPGSLTAYQITRLAAITELVLIGGLASALSAVLLGLLIVTYRTTPGQDSQW